MNNKRVYCLYRVSTIGQVEKDDIPMQKQFCRNFVEQQGWTIVREFSEKGVSGYKVSAKDRDAIQTIQQDALSGKFDVLLVYMFDRLGRRDDETPFVVEWFVKNGIEVWSAMEGQQRFDSHVDKLMNYIRYWQASGESLKTSMRVKTRLGQLTEEGHYTGGTVPFGYKAVLKGRMNKRNRDVYDLEINEDEAEIVRLIFNKYVYEGYGTQRLCRYLHEQNIKGRNGNGFPNTSLNRIIKNTLYIGVMKNGDTMSSCIEDLRIIEDNLFYRAQEMMAARTMHRNDVPLNSKGQAMLVGRIFCGHCGNRLTLTTSGRKRTRADGSVVKDVRLRYQCHYNLRHPGECDGQSGYGVTKLDAIVEEIVRMKFQELRTFRESDLILSQHEKDIEIARRKVAAAENQYRIKEKDLSDLKSEGIKVIRGESKFNAEILNELIVDATSALEQSEKEWNKVKEELEQQLATTKNLQKEYQRILSWADLYDQSSKEAKKMILSQLIKSIRVYKDYTLEIDLNISFEQLRQYCGTPADEQSAPQKLA